MYNENQSLVRAMLGLTKSGKLTWSKTACDRYEAALAGQTFTVEFIYLSRTDDVGSDRAIARLTAFSLVLDYSIGTSIGKGMDARCEMLALSDQEWSQMRDVVRQRLSEGVKFLQGL